MPVVPAGSRTKSVAVGTPYSPVSSFNPDKKLFFDTHSTTLGVLAGGVITSDGANVTIPAGTVVIQNGIIVEFTLPVVVAIAGASFPKILTFTNNDENPGSPVTVDFASSVTAPTVELARLDPDNTTVVLPKQLSIRALCQAIQALQADRTDYFQDGGLVKPDVVELNAVGPNLLLTDGGPGRVDLSAILDIKDEGSGITVKTTELNFVGPGVTVTPVTPNKALVTILGGLESKDEGVIVTPVTRKINWTGPGVIAAVDGGDPNQTNVTIAGVDTLGCQGIITGELLGDGAIRQVNAVSLIMLKAGVLSAPVTTALAIANNVSGSPRTDLVQWDGTTLTVKTGTPGALFPCPVPDGGNIPIGVVLVPDSPTNNVKSINGQLATLEPVIVAHYCAKNGIHASRVGVVINPATSSLTFVDADEMGLSVFFPQSGYKYELNWDTVMAQDYGMVREGGAIGMNFDGSDEDDLLITRNSAWGSPALLGVFEYEFYLNIHYQRLFAIGSHTLKGRYRRDAAGTGIALLQKRRRIWITRAC